MPSQAKQEPNVGIQVAGFMVSALVTGMIVLVIGGLLLFTPLGASFNSLVGEKWAWYLSRSTATVGYLLLTGSVGWGLILSTRISKELTPLPMVMDIHRFISWLALALGGLHGYLLLFDSYFNFTLLNLLVPFTGPYQPVAVGLGVIGMYIMWVTSASYGWRNWLGQKNWRLLHYLTFPAYGLVTLHGLLAGTDSQNLGMKAIYLGSVGLILFLTNYRIIVGRTPSSKKQVASSRSR